MIIVGLGNPGKKYELTRHNAGHMLVDFLNGKRKTENGKQVKTDCFMNTSGGFVKKLLAANSKLKTENLYVAHDDLDLPLGKFKISYARGPKIHNGILSIEDALGTADFWRIRIGIDNRMNEPTSLAGEGYVLSPFSEKERSLLADVFGTIAETISNL